MRLVIVDADTGEEVYAPDPVHLGMVRLGSGYDWPDTIERQRALHIRQKWEKAADRERRETRFRNRQERLARLAQKPGTPRLEKPRRPNDVAFAQKTARENRPADRDEAAEDHPARRMGQAVGAPEMKTVNVTTTQAGRGGVAEQPSTAEFALRAPVKASAPEKTVEFTPSPKLDLDKPKRATPAARTVAATKAPAKGNRKGK